jgi:hypothetical protein
MSEYIYSKVDPKVLLHAVTRKDTISHTRNNISPNEQYLQAACFKMDKGKTFKAHKHLPQNRETHITQESWIVIQGSVKAILYDLDDTIIATPILNPGDASITFRGGHNYEAMTDDTLVYEYKTGPYTGIENDKTFI